MSNMKCPFCQQELQPLAIGWCCDCGHCADKELWQRLIRTRKALELAITGLKNCKTREHIGAVCRTPEYVDKILKQITALEQKDVK